MLTYIGTDGSRCAGTVSLRIAAVETNIESCTDSSEYGGGQYS